MKEPEISIVVPMFNSEKYLRACIESILGQTFRDFEVIIIDDCSTDRSVEIVESFADPRIRLIKRGKNSGAGSARNLGIELARGKYVQFVDSDDLILPPTLEIMHSVAEKSQADVVSMNAILETEKDKPVASKKTFVDPRPRVASENIVKRISYEYINFRTRWESVLKLQRRDLLIEHQIFFPNCALAEDRLFHLAELCFSKRFEIIDFCGYVYRQHSDQTTRSQAESLMVKASAALPIAFEYIHNIFENLNLSKDLKYSLTMPAMIDYFFATFVSAFARDKNLEHTDEILKDMFFKSQISDPKFTIELVKMLTHQIITSSNYATMLPRDIVSRNRAKN